MVAETLTPETSGIELARTYWTDVVRPVLDRELPGLPRAAGRLGSGSDVLGLDDEVSRDHDWGLRLTLLVPEDRVADVDRLLADRLPETYRELPTRFATTWDPRVTHKVEVATASGFARSRTGVDASRDLTPAEWVALTGQSVLEVTAGPVFEDGPGEITAVRDRLAWYPRDLWLHVLAAEWRRVGQELYLAGRAGHRGDDLGSRVIAARVAGSLVRLGFLLERAWPPYPKWSGTLFARLPVAAAVGPALAAALAATTWPERDAALGAACDAAHDRQRELGLPALDGPAVTQFYDRPYRGLRGVPELLADGITDEAVRALPLEGAVEQWVDGVGVLMEPARRLAVARQLLA
ncbi:DUF4037 domain-containing protein [Antribacter sp. KLBMP9083]|uniref:DUF4037 domain-containing protein n=1 Tax=Antribacter soli TaxID=2910976 RepID=A0AA41U6K7_9MICO|nr:DUF4037 domain-containing protein [Antribacter soli]MCF4120556.1 DUF4037 domain-containing protein [Antribacter soli]